MKTKNMIIIILSGLCALAAIACDPDYTLLTNPPADQTAAQVVRTDWTTAADSVSSAFVERFFCSVNRSGVQGVFSFTEYNRAGANGGNYWQQAHAMAAMVDYYNRIRPADAEKAAVLAQYMQMWFGKKGNNYEWIAAYKGSTGFGNDYTDDTLWITIALLQMYEATGEQAYFTAARTTYDECVRPRFANNPYNYLPWKWTDPGANECTNGPGAIVAATLSGYARENGKDDEAEAYLQEAYRCFDQNMHAMTGDGTLGKTPLSYTQGTCMEAGRLLWHLTGEKGYLLKAIQAARGQMTSLSMNVSHNGHYVSRDEGTDGNNSVFHAVLFHWMARMIADADIDAVDGRIRKELYTYLLHHAQAYWSTGVDKSNWENSYFGTRCFEPRSSADKAEGSMGAYASAAQCFESLCLVQHLEF